MIVRIGGIVAATVALVAVAGTSVASADPISPDAAGTPQTSTSRYVRDLTGGSGDVATMNRQGCNDARNATSAGTHVHLLELGAQTTRSINTPGVLLTNTSVRLTDAQVVADVTGYLRGYAGCRVSTATGTAIVALGTNSDGYAGATFTPTQKGTDWAAHVVGPLASVGTPLGLTVVGANDIEPNFDGGIGEVRTWISAFLAGNSLSLVNNGAPVGCPSTLGVTGQSCLPVAVDNDPTSSHTWTQADHYGVSGGIAPGRISLLPQVYTGAQARQWENIDLTGVPTQGPLVMAGVLTENAACGSCSLTPAKAFTALKSALAYKKSTASTRVPAVTDLRIDG